MSWFFVDIFDQSLCLFWTSIYKIKEFYDIIVIKTKLGILLLDLYIGGTNV